MNKELTTDPYRAVDGPAGGLELGMQELEAMDAPGFWTGAFNSALIVTAITAVGVAAT
ncbi:daptide-type RiPP [Nakamurella sp.]|uniref:daptide-type RiPP n=1 Tax=Nakamurella sp. TaxID=1869182 RepID=UPI003B3A45CE